jgi:hypothetical protein
MPAHKMRFVMVNNRTPRDPSVCTACSRPLERGYLYDLAASRRYCGVECYTYGRWGAEQSKSVATTNPFELAIALPRLTVDVASALFDSKRCFNHT